MSSIVHWLSPMSALSFFPSRPMTAAGGGLPEHVPVEHPRRNALDLLHAGHAVHELGRCDPGEEVVRLGEVRVGVDDEGVVVQH